MTPFGRSKDAAVLTPFLLKAGEAPASLEAYRQEDNKVKQLYTSAAIARTLGITEKEVKALTKTGVIRKGVTNQGLYDLGETAREILANYKKPEDERENVDYTAERAKLMRIKRKDAEYNLQLRKGELHQSEEVEMILSKMIVSFKARLSAIPSRAAPQVAKITDVADIFDLLKKLIDEALTELSDFEKLSEGELNGEQSEGH